MTTLPEQTAERSGETPPRDAVRSSLADRIRERWKVPVITEDTRGEGKRSPRSPVTEDLPSPRCVFEDYREGARHYGDGALLVSAAYWAVVAVPLAFNMTMATGHVASQRPGRFWIFCVLVPGLFTVCLLAFS